MSDSDSDDNVIRYGTPLEPYEEDEVPSKRKYQEPADQYAVDDHGRRRFHGAFTGGFSAGFGNTVGSQEGWTPQQFKSSRQEKAAFSSQRPEDFMDEEDRSEFGIAPKQVQTSSDFSGQKRQRPRGFHDGPIPGEPVLGQLLRPVHETVAVRMLRSMGWRAGQGAGARLQKREKRRAAEHHKIYGCYMPPELRPKEDPHSDHEDSSDSEVDYETLFAPDDYEPYILSQKNDRFGLGYKGLSRHSVLGNLSGEYGADDNSSRLVMKEKGKKVSIRGQAFGVGAFEADDEDIYASEDMSHYDFTLGPSKQKQKANPAVQVNVLQGFTRAVKPFPTVAVYPPPALPRDYVPLAAGSRRTRFQPTDAPQRDQGLGRHELTAEARGKLLGEEPPNPITQIDETPTNKPANKDELLAKIMGRNLDFISIETKTPTKIIDMTKKDENSVDYISIKDSGKEITNVFKPFVTNPKKQARYETFCEKGMLERDGCDDLSEWEREREMVEFEQAAKLYRPLTGIMGDRFTHASQADEAINPLRAVSRSSPHAAAPAQEAAARGAYGALTRSHARWSPHAALCKRFNVPDPMPHRSEPKKEERPKVSYSVFSYMESSVHDKNSFAKEQGKFSGSMSQREHTSTDQKQQTTDRNTPSSDQGSLRTNQNTRSSDQSSLNADQNDDGTGQANNELKSPVQKITAETNSVTGMTVAELFMKESESTKEQGKEVTETIEKFDKMDLYKSIFLSDSEEEIEDMKTGDKGKTDFVEAPKNVARNTSPPRGIFANIDFDEINSWKRNDENPKEKSLEKEMPNTEEIYGPKIPENLKHRLETSNNEPYNQADKVSNVEVIDTSSDDSWVEAKEVKAKKSKKKKKHKSKDKKKKHKKKDR